MIRQLNPLSLRVSVTDRCQLRCSYCMPADGVAKRPPGETVRFEEIIRFVRAAKSGFGLSKVHITGGEPLVRTGIVELVRLLAQENIPDLALTTNGQMLAGMAGKLKRAGLNRINLSLDSLNDETFRKLTGGGRLYQSLSGIRASLDHNLRPLKLNTVVLRGINDHEVASIARFGLARTYHVRFLELMPIGCAKDTFDDHFVSSVEVRARLQNCLDLQPLPHEPGQSSRTFLASDRHGRSGIIGFISPTSHPFCSECRRMRLTSSGRLICCLARGSGANIRHLLQNDSTAAAENIQLAISQQLSQKPAIRQFQTPAPMVAVGG